jgi:hypothetical protein
MKTLGITTNRSLNELSRARYKERVPMNRGTKI